MLSLARAETHWLAAAAPPVSVELVAVELVATATAAAVCRLADRALIAGQVENEEESIDSP